MSPSYCHGHDCGDQHCHDLRLEAVTVCVGFDDMLDVTLGRNHPHLDTAIVVTSHSDRRTQQVAYKHGAILVLTDLFTKNGLVFNKGAAINAGFYRFQYRGWRMHLDADIILPDGFRRMLFNHTHLDRKHLYGCDRVNVVGMNELHKFDAKWPQHRHGFLVGSQIQRPIGHRYVNTLEGYLPIGCFQMWHASTQKSYPYGQGDAAHSDIMFASQWPREHRTLLPSVICYHLCSRNPVHGENWSGDRKMPRLPGL